MNSRLLLRLIGPTLSVGILLLLLGGMAAWYLHRLQKESSVLLAQSITKVRAAEELGIISQELRGFLQQYLLSGDPKTLQSISQLRKQADTWIAEAERLISSQDERNLVEQIRRGYEHFFRQFDSVQPDAGPSERNRKVYSLLQDVAPKRIEEPARLYRSASQEWMTRASERNQMVADRMGLVLLLLGSCGAVAGLLMGYAFARSLYRSLVQLSVPIRDASGKLSEVVGPITVSSTEDLSELEATLHILSQRIETVIERLQESQKAATRAEQLAAVGQLAAGLAHELRNPLTSIQILIQSATEPGGSAALDKRDVVVLEEEISRLDRTIRTFLDYARPPKLQMSSVTVWPILEQTVELVSREARHRGVRIECEPPAAAVAVNGDAGQIRQVLLNLLLNALDASPEGGIVSARIVRCPDSDKKHEGPSGWVRIEIADQGQGIPAGLEERIFDPFFSTKETGTGLGLPICRRIIEEHGGRIMASNRSQGGALFLVLLPAGPASPPIPEATPLKIALVQPEGERHANAVDRR